MGVEGEREERAAVEGWPAGGVGGRAGKSTSLSLARPRAVFGRELPPAREVSGMVWWVAVRQELVELRTEEHRAALRRRVKPCGVGHYFRGRPSV